MNLIARLTNLKRVFYSGFGLSLFPILFLVLVGTIGYANLEGWSWLDALYATIITITTVGYGDLSPQTFGGRIFAIIFTVSAIGIASYAISTLAAVVINWESDRIKRQIQDYRMQQIANLKDHVIICGGGGVARSAALFFQRAGQSVLLVEDSEDKLRLALLHLDVDYLRKKYGRYHDITQAVDITEDERLPLEELAERIEVPFLLANPTEDSTLMAAGIKKAKGLVAALESDQRNLFVVLSARAIANELDNAQLRIVAMVHDDKNGHKLQIAGADQLVIPEKASGQQVKLSMSNPHLGAFYWEVSFKGGSHEFQDFSVAQHTEWVGQSIEALQQALGVMVLAVQRNGRFQYMPKPQQQLNLTDTLIIFAPRAVVDTPLANIFQQKVSQQQK